MNDWSELVAVSVVATLLVGVAYGIILLQSQVFTALLTKYAQLSAKDAQLLTHCINDFLLIDCPDYLALSTL